jgi:ATP-dependent Lon protease
MSSLTAGWILSGASAQWNNAKPGKVAHTLVHGDYANPIVVLDEIDKAGGDSRYDPMGALYSLLEHDTAKAFKDEFIDIDIDASHILWVTTANDERSIPEPILNRMNVYEVPRPDRDASLSIAAALYRDCVSEHDWGFPAEAGENVLERLASLPPRDMKKRLLNAFGTAKLEGRNWLEAPISNRHGADAAARSVSDQAAKEMRAATIAVRSGCTDSARQSGLAPHQVFRLKGCHA